MKIRKCDMLLLQFLRPRRLMRLLMFLCGLFVGTMYLTASPAPRTHKRPTPRPGLRMGDRVRSSSNDVFDQHMGGQEWSSKNFGNWSNDLDDITYPPFVAKTPPHGRGEYGRPVTVFPNHLSAEAKQMFDEGYKKHSFNQFVSDIVSVTRRLPDPGPPQCRSLSHQSRHKASVILCFHNEAWSTLLRSVHSIINRSPPHLLQEIILVDDASDQEYLGAALEKYMSALGIVKILRTGQREGLIRARLLGYKHATAPVLVFLDSHIECFPGWLEPLLDRIAENPYAVPYPTIESIKSDTLSVKPRAPLSVGTFSWSNLIFRWIGIHELRTKPSRSPTAPIKSATMPGGLFAISRDYFTLLGAYDPGLDYWGGENIELSFKAWMCNGSVELLPCSHVGHIFRHNNPIHWPIPGSVRRNAARVAEVWMDDYKKFFYETTGSDKVVVGDISERQELRRSLHCHDFEWYLKNVLPELLVPTDCLTVGEIRNAAYNNCLDSMGRQSKVPSMYTCQGEGYNQFWCMQGNGQIWNYHQHLYVKDGNVSLNLRHGISWTYTQAGKKTLAVLPCSGHRSQVWTLTPRPS
ncbi:putative polypeptide N-acetylgalactosaminyltransferase 9 [Haliotis rubra]|uniref:putative polypeptide N-acetylgalactosaminyltransferase 9 n=1 Tax=Haliotis rubra TaxID=36100 RepID=UPI001EE4F2F0|nr:putative polypeptide N-acetylgalactosaminyltransferase 9 [Haliotis rubra]